MAELLRVQNLTRRFDGITALDDFSCDVQKMEVVGLIGPNGAGKSTLFNVLTGFIPAETGKAYFRGKLITGRPAEKIARMGMARTFQDLRLVRQMTVLDNVLLCFQNQAGEHLRNLFFRRGRSLKLEKENKERALALLEYAGIAEKANGLANDLSYGQQKLLSIVCCLAADAKLLLLDEPVAGLSPGMIEKILTIIRDLPKDGKSVILIEHNMDAVSQVCERVLFMDAGKKISEGTPEQVRKDSGVIKAYLD